MSGSNLTNQIGIYGTKGVPSQSNVPGGMLGSISWVDNEGSFWIFGGYDYSKDTKHNSIQLICIRFIRLFE
jgi:hypothetical protein